MPLCTHSTFEGGGIAIWRIEESAETLYAMLDTTRYDDAGKSEIASLIVMYGFSSLPYVGSG